MSIGADILDSICWKHNFFCIQWGGVEPTKPPPSGYAIELISLKVDQTARTRTAAVCRQIVRLPTRSFHSGSDGNNNDNGK